VGSWALYDLANTIFSFNIISIYLPLWVVNDMGGRDSDYGLASSLSMGIVFLTAPFVGAMSDQTPRRMPWLIVTTLIAVLFTALLGRDGLWMTLAFFVVANVFYQTGLIFYDALLPSVSTPENRGRIGGIGVGLGYFGSIVGVTTGILVLSADPSGKPLVFLLTATFFLLFALPCFLFVREVPRVDGKPLGMAAFRGAVAELAQTTRRVRHYPGLGRFLVGRVFYSDAANTMIAFMGIYVTNEVGLNERDTQLLLITSIVASIVGGFAWGFVVDRIGPKRALDRVLWVWIACFAIVSAVGGLDLPSWLIWVAGPLAGIALGGTVAADRPLMLQLSPPRYLGQCYGLYAMVGRFASIMGPLLWSLVVDGLGLGRPMAVLSLLGMVIVSMLIIRPVPNERREWPAEDQLPTEQPA
jgi:UMF1 family MFS transporter